MRIVSNDGATTLSHDGVVYAAVDGAFDVPESVGEQLTSFPSFDKEYVAQDRAVAEAAELAKSVEGILARIANLEAAVFPNGSEPDTAATPVPAPVVVPSVPEAPVVSDDAANEAAGAPTDPTVVPDEPIQADAAPTEPPIAEPDAPVEIPPVETPVEDASADAAPDDVLNTVEPVVSEADPSEDVPANAPSEDAPVETPAEPVIVGEVPAEETPAA